MKRKLYIIFIFLSNVALAQAPEHPTANHTGKYSKQTGLSAYTDAEGLASPMKLKKANKFSEKSILYFGKEPSSYPYYKNLYSTKVIQPPNGLPIGSDYFMESTEVANIHYLEFLHFISLDSSLEKANLYIPILNEEELNNYFYNPEFYFYPVVAVTKEQAEGYCLWKSQILNVKLAEMLKEHNFKEHLSIVKNGKTHQFKGRLPTREEWLRVAKIAFEEKDSIEIKPNIKAFAFIKNDIEKFGYVSNIDQSKIGVPIKLPRYNLSDTKPSFLNWKIPFYIYSYKPSKHSYYNLIGNVSEIVQEGYGLGGSYNTPYRNNLAELKTEQIPSLDVGFRCVCEVKKIK